MITTRAGFNEWVNTMESAIEQFLKALPKETAEQLDFTLPSLSVMEKWLLERYDSLQAIMLPEEAFYLDRAARYVGETILKYAQGEWDIDLENPYAAYYQRPVIRTASWIDCPSTLVTASLDRRKGNYIQQVVSNLISER